VRFAVRLGFKIEGLTESYIRFAIASGIYDRLREANHPAPALTTRLRAELKYILDASYWQDAIKLLNHLEALKCLHSELVLTSELWFQLRCLSRWLKIFDPENSLEHWLMRLEVLLAALNPLERVKIAHYLLLPKESIDRLQQLEQAETEIPEQLAHCQKKSEVVFLLRRYKFPLLLLVASRSSQPLRRQLWDYITKLSKVQPSIDGNDLKKMGYRPSPQYKEILDALLRETLDGAIGDRTSAEAFVRLNYRSIAPPSPIRIKGDQR
jgi:tRNA nucleotidyltransferase (CCA-adding enzyme)